MKYDDASWHYGADDFPGTLPESAGATHIALFVAWAVQNGLASDYHLTSGAGDLARLEARQVSPALWFLSVCDEKFTDEDLSVEGNAFASAYYADEAGLNVVGYVGDYASRFNCECLYEVPDSWESYDRIAPLLTRKLKTWRFQQFWSRLFGGDRRS